MDVLAAFSISILLLFGIMFLLSFAIELEYRSCNENTLRIEKVTLENDDTMYYLRHKTRLFWIGPYVWKYYHEVYDGNFASHIGFTWFRCIGDAFETYDAAKQEYDNLINLGSKIVNKEIVDVSKKGTK